MLAFGTQIMNRKVRVATRCMMHCTIDTTHSSACNIQAAHYTPALTSNSTSCSHRPSASPATSSNCCHVLHDTAA